MPKFTKEVNIFKLTSKSAKEMKITYNHIIKFLLIAGITTVSIIGNFYILRDGFDTEVTIFTAVAYFVDVAIISVMFFAVVALISRWADGNFDDVLDKPLFKFPGKTSLIEDLKSHLEEAQRINDVEEITRLRNSIEIIEKYRK